MRVFFLRQGAKRALAQQVAAKPKEIEYAAVIGGGTMGAGIVHAMVKAGIQVRLIEVDAKALAAGLRRLKGMLYKDLPRGPPHALQAKNTLHRVSPTHQYPGPAPARPCH